MQIEKNIPDYLTDEFSMYLENMSSLSDPENPELLSTYLTDLFEQLKSTPLLFSGMVDQLAMAISTKIKIDSKKIALLNLSTEPEWIDIRACIGVHAQAREVITQIMADAEQDLKIAILLIHFYNRYDSTPISSEEDHRDEIDDYLPDDFDENY